MTIRNDLARSFDQNNIARVNDFQNKPVSNYLHPTPKTLTNSLPVQDYQRSTTEDLESRLNQLKKHTYNHC